MCLRDMLLPKEDMKRKLKKKTQVMLSNYQPKNLKQYSA